MSEQHEWPGPEPECGTYTAVETVVILALSVVIGLLVGLLVWKFWS